MMLDNILNVSVCLLAAKIRIQQTEYIAYASSSSLLVPEDNTEN